MTLRKLTWMCGERKRVWGELAAWHAAVIVAHLPFTATRLNVEQLNPYRVGRQNGKLEAVRQFIASMGLAALARGDEG